MIQVHNVTKKYGKFTAVEGISFVAEKGSVFGLVGYNGAGKTTLIKTMAGILRPEHGSVTAEGEDVFDNAGYHQKMSFVPDENYYPPQASLDDMRRIYRGYYPRWSDKTYKKLAELFLLERRQKINNYSKGMQRQSAILLALATHPGYLLLDEAFDGLDYSKRTLLRTLLRDYAREKGAVIVVSSHNLLELEEFADRVGILNEHRFTFEGSVENMRRNCAKYHAEFDSAPSSEKLRELGLTNIQRLNDKTVSFLHSSEDDVFPHERLEALGGHVIGKMPVTLEEFFLEETDAQTYRFDEIF